MLNLADMDNRWIGKIQSVLLSKDPEPRETNWGYKNDLYFGVDEYFQMCEDLGAEPVYTSSAGISETSHMAAMACCLST